MHDKRFVFTEAGEMRRFTSRVRVVRVDASDVERRCKPMLPERATRLRDVRASWSSR
jgi:hypothetical protein